MCAFSSGYLRRPVMANRATRASRLTGFPGSRALSAARAASRPVASTSTQTVASGISRRERVSLSPAAWRTRRSGIRTSPGVTADVAAASGVMGVVGVASRSRAALTSRRSTTPSGRVPGIPDTSSPASRASLRTSGELTGTGPVLAADAVPASAGGAASAVFAGGAGRAAFAAGSGRSAFAAGSGRSAFAGGSGCAGCGTSPGRRRPDLARRGDGAVPYPTSTFPLASWAAAGSVTPGSCRPEDRACAATLISGAPTVTVVPGAACRTATVPANGIGSSTTALAVSTSATIWSMATWSPTWTRQAMTSASSRPSPRSGSRKSGRIVVPLQPGDRVQDPVHAGQMMLFELGRRIGDIKTGNAQYRRQQVVKALLRQPGGHLGAVSAEARRLVHDHRAAGAADRGGDGRVVERRQAAQVHHLDIPAFLGRGGGGFHGGTHRTAVADQGDVPTWPADDRPIDPWPGIGRDRLPGPVPALRLEEDDRIGTRDGLEQEVVCVRWRGRRDDPEAWRVRVVRLGGITVVLDTADGAAVRDAHHDGQAHPAPGAVAQLGQVAGYLLERRVSERVELHLDHGDQAVHGHADRGADDPGLGQRGIKDPFLAEPRGQAVGHPEHSAEGPDILAEDEYPRVVLEGGAEGRVQRRNHGDRLRGRDHSRGHA